MAYTFGAIGAGHMGLTVLDAAVQSKNAAPGDVLVYELNAERAQAARLRGFTIAENEAEVYAEAAVMMLAVPPQAHILQPLMEKLSQCAKRGAERPTVLNIMAGIGSDYIRRHLGADTPVVCVMPTMGMAVGQGAAAIAHTENVPPQTLSAIKRVFEATGEAFLAKEEDLKEIVAANGCTPGYAYYLMDAIARAAAGRGIDYDMAVRMVARGFAGAAETLLSAKAGNPQDLLAQVCTPGGLTAEGIASFEANQVAARVAEGVGASIRRGYEFVAK